MFQKTIFFLNFRAVKITYKNKQKPILTIREALSGGSRSLIKKNVSMKPSEKGRPFTPSMFSNLSTGNIGGELLFNECLEVNSITKSLNSFHKVIIRFAEKCL